MKDRPHSRLWVPEKQATTDAHELPPETQTETETRDTELKDRVIRRAQELLREWMETDGEPGHDKRDSHAKPEEEPPGVEEGKKDQAANHGKGDAVQVSLEPYRRWTPRPLPDPRAAAQFNVAQELTEIIAAEGPMVCHRAFRIYVKAAGIQKVGLEGIKFEVFHALHGAIRLAKKLEWIEERNEFETYDQINHIVRKAGTPAVVLRTLGNRTFQDIPPAEIGEMMKCLRTLEPDLDDEALLLCVLKHYELVYPPIESMTPGMRARLLQIKDQFVDRRGDSGEI